MSPVIVDAELGDKIDEISNLKSDHSAVELSENDVAEDSSAADAHIVSKEQLEPRSEEPLLEAKHNDGDSIALESKEELESLAKDSLAQDGTDSSPTEAKEDGQALADAAIGDGNSGDVPLISKDVAETGDAEPQSSADATSSDPLRDTENLSEAEVKEERAETPDAAPVDHAMDITALEILDKDEGEGGSAENGEHTLAADADPDLESEGLPEASATDNEVNSVDETEDRVLEPEAEVELKPELTETFDREVEAKLVAEKGESNVEPSEVERETEPPVQSSEGATEAEAELKPATIETFDEQVQTKLDAEENGESKGDEPEPSEVERQTESLGESNEGATEPEAELKSDIIENVDEVVKTELDAEEKGEANSTEGNELGPPEVKWQTEPLEESTEGATDSLSDPIQDEPEPPEVERETEPLVESNEGATNSLSDPIQDELEPSEVERETEPLVESNEGGTEPEADLKPDIIENVDEVVKTELDAEEKGEANSTEGNELGPSEVERQTEPLEESTEGATDSLSHPIQESNLEELDASEAIEAKGDLSPQSPEETETTPVLVVDDQTDATVSVQETFPNPEDLAIEAKSEAISENENTPASSEAESAGETLTLSGDATSHELEAIQELKVSSKNDTTDPLESSKPNLEAFSEANTVPLSEEEEKEHLTEPSEESLENVADPDPTIREKEDSNSEESSVVTSERELAGLEAVPLPEKPESSFQLTVDANETEKSEESAVGREPASDTAEGLMYLPELDDQTSPAGEEEVTGPEVSADGISTVQEVISTDDSNLNSQPTSEAKETEEFEGSSGVTEETQNATGPLDVTPWEAEGVTPDGQEVTPTINPRDESETRVHSVSEEADHLEELSDEAELTTSGTPEKGDITQLPASENQTTPDADETSLVGEKEATATETVADMNSGDAPEVPPSEVEGDGKSDKGVASEAIEGTSHLLLQGAQSREGEQLIVETDLDDSEPLQAAVDPTTESQSKAPQSPETDGQEAAGLVLDDEEVGGEGIEGGDVPPVEGQPAEMLVTAESDVPNPGPVSSEVIEKLDVPHSNEEDQERNDLVPSVIEEKPPQLEQGDLNSEGIDTNKIEAENIDADSSGVTRNVEATAAHAEASTDIPSFVGELVMSPLEHEAHEHIEGGGIPDVSLIEDYFNNYTADLISKDVTLTSRLPEAPEAHHVTTVEDSQTDLKREDQDEPTKQDPEDIHITGDESTVLNPLASLDSLVGLGLELGGVIGGGEEFEKPFPNALRSENPDGVKTSDNVREFKDVHTLSADLPGEARKLELQAGEEDEQTSERGSHAQTIEQGGVDHVSNIAPLDLEDYVLVGRVSPCESVASSSSEGTVLLRNSGTDGASQAGELRAADSKPLTTWTVDDYSGDSGKLTKYVKPDLTPESSEPQEDAETNVHVNQGLRLNPENVAKEVKVESVVEHRDLQVLQGDWQESADQPTEHLLRNQEIRKPVSSRDDPSETQMVQGSTRDFPAASASQRLSRSVPNSEPREANNSRFPFSVVLWCCGGRRST